MNDGGPVQDFASISLRDWFAGQALIAFASCAPWMRGFDAANTKAGGDFKAGLATNAYIMADAMLAERAKQP